MFTGSACANSRAAGIGSTIDANLASGRARICSTCRRPKLGGSIGRLHHVHGVGRGNVAAGLKTASVETWEEIALWLAGQAGIATPQHKLIEVAGKAVMLSRRFHRNGAIRIPFLSAMAMMGTKDGERGSYPEIVDALAQHGA